MSTTLLATILSVVCSGQASEKPAGAIFRAGVSKVDVTPEQWPVLVNGGFLQSQTDHANDRLHARCLVLDDGKTRLAIVVVDTCMMPRELIDRAKTEASQSAGIPADRTLISATHTHSAPAAMGALGCSPDEKYIAFLPGRIAEAIAKASANLQPARIGWAVIDDPDHTHCRRWIRRPDRQIADPFGQLNVRAHMHPGYQNPDVIAPSGPSDPGLSVLAVSTPDGRPLGLLANYSMHYYGAAPLSADYFGRFSERIGDRIGPVTEDFVGMMSQGTSGDQHWMDYSQPRNEPGLDAYADAVIEKAAEAFRSITFHDWVPLTMAQTRLKLGRRVPDEARLAWARPIVEALGDRPPTSIPEVYAREAVFLHNDPERELILQAIRVGDLGIAAIPDEVYAITGLKLKAMSPLRPTFTIELANGSEGYIPPPEQHALGGYTTWPARTAGLEVQAEPRIVESVLGLLEQVSGSTRRDDTLPPGSYTQAVLGSNPDAYWRLDELSGRNAKDASGHDQVAEFEDGIALALPGAARNTHAEGSFTHAIHCAGGRLRAEMPTLGQHYSVEFWFWNGLPDDARPVTGYLLSHGPENAEGAPGLHLGIGGTSGSGGRLFVFNGNESSRILPGTTPLGLKTWHQVVVTRDGSLVTVYLDGKPEIEGTLEATEDAPGTVLFLGGRTDRFAGLEGKLDEVTVYKRILSPEEIQAHLSAVRRR